MLRTSTVPKEMLERATLGNGGKKHQKTPVPPQESHGVEKKNSKTGCLYRNLLPQKVLEGHDCCMTL